MVKRLLTVRETWVQYLGWEDLLEKEMAIHSSILAWKIPWTEKPGRLESMGSHKVGHDWMTSLSLFFFKLNIVYTWVLSEVAQLCLTLCNPMHCSLPASSLHGILQVRILEWVAISFSRGSSWPRDLTRVSCIAGRCFNLWATREAQYMGFNTRQNINLKLW